MITSDNEDSVMLADLEQARVALMAQLKENGSDNEDSTPSAELSRTDDGGDPEKKSATEQPPEAELDPTSSSQEPEECTSQSRLLALGTPVSIRHSPFNALPAINKFATDMGDLELFQNLPNSTGAYQRVKSVLQKAKTALKKE